MNGLEEVRRFVAFNAVGVVTTLVGLPVMVVLDGWGVPYPTYTALNTLLGILLGFWLNFRYAFQDRRSSLRTALGRYLGGFLALAAVVQGLQWLLIDGAGWPRWWGVAAGMVVYGGLGYALSVFWIFRPEGSRVKT